MANAFITRRGGNGVAKVINLEMTMSTTEPIPIRKGHVWVKADIEDKIKNIKFTDTLLTTAENGTLQIVADLKYQRIKVAHNITINNKDVLVSMETRNNVNTWLVTNTSNNDEYLELAFDDYPYIYSTIDGILNIHDAYIWDETNWVMCSQSGYYLNIPLGTESGLYNIISTTSVLANTVGNNTTHDTMNTISPKGTYYFNGQEKKFYKKSGDVYQFFVDSPISNTDNPKSKVVFSPDEKMVVIAKTKLKANVYRITNIGLELVNQDFNAFSVGSENILKGVCTFVLGSQFLIYGYGKGLSEGGYAHYDICKYNEELRTYEIKSTMMTTYWWAQATHHTICALGNQRAFIWYTMTENRMQIYDIDSDGLSTHRKLAYYTYVNGGGNSHAYNYVFTDTSGKWAFIGSLTVDLTSGVSDTLMRGRMIVVNTEKYTNQTKLIWDSAIKICGVFESQGDGLIRVLAYLANYGYVIVTWKDTGADTLTYVEQSLIKPYSTNAYDSLALATFCPSVAN